DDTEGGYLVERRIGKEIYQMMYQSSILLPKCSSTEVGPNQNGMKINQVNETARSNTSLFGGIRVYSPDEGATKTAFIQKYAQVDIPLGKYAAVNYMTDEMWQDRVGYVNYMRQNVGPAIAWYVDDDILHGTTNARMIEIENHAATVQVNVAGANPTAAELMNMYTAMAPMAIGGAEWYMSLTQYAAISQLESTAGVRIVQPNYVISPYGTLLGKPINIIEQADVDANDTSIMFLNLKWYLVLTKGKLQEASSIHVRFLEDESCFRWVLRLAGSPKLASTVTLPNGSIVSPFVTRN
ncbi:MAG: phage major capsid protein, partial [Gammaproteobacteria bacterium]|nr:phage major capsid protein [Gammaproteobacteria bacterium]